MNLQEIKWSKKSQYQMTALGIPSMRHLVGDKNVGKNSWWLLGILFRKSGTQRVKGEWYDCARAIKRTLSVSVLLGIFTGELD